MRARRGLAGLLLLATVIGASGCRTQETTAQDWQMQDHIAVIDGQTWVVGNRLVTIAPAAQVDGEPVEGALVQLQGQRTAAGELVAQSVQVLDAPERASSTPVAPAAQATADEPSQPAPASSDKGGHATPKRRKGG